jgi:hypothetical protein
MPSTLTVTNVADSKTCDHWHFRVAKALINFGTIWGHRKGGIAVTLTFGHFQKNATAAWQRS